MGTRAEAPIAAFVLPEDIQVGEPVMFEPFSPDVLLDAIDHIRNSSVPVTPPIYLNRESYARVRAALAGRGPK